MNVRVEVRTWGGSGECGSDCGSVMVLMNLWKRCSCVMSCVSLTALLSCSMKPSAGRMRGGCWSKLSRRSAVDARHISVHVGSSTEITCRCNYREWYVNTYRLRAPRPRRRRASTLRDRSAAARTLSVCDGAEPRSETGTPSAEPSTTSTHKHLSIWIILEVMGFQEVNTAT